MNAFLITIAADIPEIPVSTEQQLQIDRQNILLEQFFGAIDSAYMEKRMGNRSIREVCDWEELPNCIISCWNGLIHGMHLDGVQHGNFLIEYLPSTVAEIFIHSCKQKYQLQTRMLPRHIRWFSMYKNKLFGTIDLQGLPPRTLLLDVSRNNISGPIILRDLPQAMYNIFLDNNKIQQDVLFYSNLPVSLKLVSLRGNRIRAIQPTGENVDHRDIFHGI